MTLDTRCELLAPAGNWECARAAVENGADAIYFGLDVGFNARARAANFHVDELSQLVEMLHRQAVRGYVTLNTLVFTDELPVLEDHVRRLAAAGIDAVLVQDLGVARLIRELCPDMEVHASTQMTMTNPQGIEAIRELGISRVVLGREMSIREIRQTAELTSMPLEVFVHGALCVAYSGQCLTSESFGGRSANRGQCAQACRLPYDLYCDDQHLDLGEVKYLLSPQDLAAHDLVPELIDTGVCSLKIEGRLKTPEYVANTCSHYRAAIDAALANEPRSLAANEKRELELSFSRGFTPGWLEGCDHKRLVPGDSSSKRGVLLGSVIASHGDEIKIELESPLATGDGIVLQGDRFEGQEIGGRVYELRVEKRQVDSLDAGTAWVGMQRGILPDQIPPGTRVWKTDDPKLTKRLRRSFDSNDPTKRVPIDLTVSIEVEKPIEIMVEYQGQRLKIESEYRPETARKHPVTPEVAQEQLGRLGGTVYRLGSIETNIAGKPMVPHSIWGLLRRQLVEWLDGVKVTTPITCATHSVTSRLLDDIAERESQDQTGNAADSSSSTPESVTPVLRVLCRSLEQLRHALAAGVKHAIVDFQDIRQYREAVAMAHEEDARVEIATLRIHKPGEDGLFRALAKHGADGWLVRNLAALRYCREQKIDFATDFSLNVTNPITADLLRNWGATRLTASYDLNRDQLFELAQAMPSRWLEIVIHQHMPMFHMEHCVFCNALSPGKNKSDCGRPCDRHDVKLEDRVGSKHVLHADIGCRNTLYNGTAQSGAEAVRPLQEIGVRQFRIELLRDAPETEVVELIGLYRQLIAGRLDGSQVWKKLKAHNRVGVTRGTLEQPRNPLAIL